MPKVKVWSALLAIGVLAGCNTRRDDSVSRASAQQATGEARTETTNKPLGVSAMQRAHESARAAYDAKDWAGCSDQFLAIAKFRRDDEAYSYYFSACCLALAGETNRAFDSLAQAVNAGWWKVEHMQNDEDLASLRGDPRWPKIVELARTKAPSEPALRDEILGMYAEDQAVRMAWIPNLADQAAAARVTEVDRRNTARMKQIVARYGWPGYKLVAKDGANAAFLLVQHADADLPFQKDCLAKLQSAVAAGDASPMNLAYLHDRVAVAEKRKQRYGTQFGHPIEDEAHVDARRAAVGLGTLAEYQAELEAMYGSKRVEN